MSFNAMSAAKRLTRTKSSPWRRRVCESGCKARLIGLLWVAFLAFTGQALAHDPGLSSCTLQIAKDHLAVELRIHQDDYQRLRNELSRPPEPSELVEVRSGNRSLEPRSDVEPQAEEDHYRLSYTLERPEAPDLHINATFLQRMRADHRLFLTLSGDKSQSVLLDSRIPSWELRLPRDASVSESRSVDAFTAFFSLGLEHIFTGYDHLMFLLAILVACASLMGMLRVITLFTLAHSITLALGACGWVSLPPPLIEGFIAASIVYVGVLALRAPNEKRVEPLILTFAFGLIHGLGFAGALKDLLPQGVTSVVPLLAFNLGVEVGQVAVAAVVLPLLLAARRSRIAVVNQYLTPVTSVVVIGAGAYWLFERAFFTV